MELSCKSLSLSLSSLSSPLLTQAVCLSFSSFSSKPKKGIKLLQEKDLLGKSAVEVAKFFHSDVRLDRTAMGDYMGEGDE